MKKLMTLAIVSLVLAFMTTSTAVASHHHEKAIKELIKEHFQLVAEGEFEKTRKNIHPKAVYFGPHGGLLGESPSGDANEEQIQKAKKEYEKGRRVRLTPKHIKVMVDEEGNSAFATHYIEGTITEEDGEEEHARSRATVVFTNEEGDWKIIHWHISPIKSADEDD